MSNASNAAPAADTNADATPDFQKNDKRHADLMKQVRTLGSDGAAGRDSLPKLAHAVVKAAADGVIDLETKDKDGDDAATSIYKAYAKADSNKALHEHKEGGVKANASKLRQLIKMGCMTTIDAVEVMQAAHEAREELKKNKDIKLKPAYHYYVDVARAQVDKDKPLSKASLSDLATKSEGEPKELIDRLKQVQKLLQGLVTGENRDKLKDQDALTIAAQEAIDERIKQIEQATFVADMRKKAAALGLTIV